MVMKETLKNDDRFYVDDWNLDKFVAHKAIVKYRIKEMKVGDILRKWNGRIYPLNESDVYKCLEKKSATEADYEVYRKNCSNDDYEHHTLESFQLLQKELDTETYDLKKGAIFVDQFNCIIDGQHRSCILLMKYGSEYTIPVVEITYKQLGIRTRLKYYIYLCKKFFREGARKNK